eukprot:15226882-Alexandrium_andersonii.AAC.1
MVLSAGVGSASATRGEATEEYLAQVALARHIDIHGQSHRNVVMREPLALTNGKTALALFAAGRGLVPPAGAMGHVGASIAHYVQLRPGVLRCLAE